MDIFEFEQDLAEQSAALDTQARAVQQTVGLDQGVNVALAIIRLHMRDICEIARLWCDGIPVSSGTLDHTSDEFTRVLAELAGALERMGRSECAPHLRKMQRTFMAVESWARNLRAAYYDGTPAVVVVDVDDPGDAREGAEPPVRAA